MSIILLLSLLILCEISNYNLVIFISYFKPFTRYIKFSWNLPRKLLTSSKFNIDIYLLGSYLF